MTESHNLSARMARWSAHHRKIAIFGWLAFCFVAFAFGTLALGVTSLDASNAGVRESGRMDRLLDKDFKTPAGERVIVQSKTLTANDPRFAAVVADVVRRLKTNKTVTNFTTPEEDTGLISSDRHSVLIDFEVTGDPDTAADRVQPVLDTTAAAQAAHSDFVIEEFGAASGDKQLNKVFADDLKKAGELSVPITLGILLLTFGALVAAGIPLLLGLTAVLATMGLLAIPSKIFPMDDSIGAVVLLIGLAVGVDYTMFYLKREREERREGKSPEEALQIAAATSGRSVLISGLTVMIAMAGLFLTGDPTFKGFGAATILVVAVAVLGSLTVLPAMLSWLGDRVERIHLPVIKSLRPKHGESRFWSAILGPVLRHPIPAILLSTGFLLILCVVALQLKTVVPGADTYPQSLSTVKTYRKMQKAFPGGETPAEIVIKANNVRSPEVKEAIGQLSWRALVKNVMYEPILTDVNKAGTVAVVSIPVAGSGTDATSQKAVNALRDEILPNTLGLVPAIEDYGVTGQTAGSKDFNDQMGQRIPYVFGFVIFFAFLLLMITFRSIVIPTVSIMLNLLSVGACYGVLVLVFQHGIGKGILNFSYTDGVAGFIPVFLFVILFGLSMDYHVFILSRVREGYDEGRTTADAVAHGVKVSAAVVTSAAIVMVFVFAIFGTLQILFLKQFGVGLAAAILIDATIIRAVLLPATLKLLGDWNWYLPHWLEWLPRVEREKAPKAPPVPAR
jgi:RND superfamily putative drug exporter